MLHHPVKPFLDFVLDADLESGPVLQDLSVIAKVDIESVDFRHPQMPDGLRGFQNGVLGRFFPSGGAAADDFNHLIRAHGVIFQS